MRVEELGWDARGLPDVRLGPERRRYQLLVGATGVKTGGLSLYEALGLTSRPRGETFVTDLNLGLRQVSRTSATPCTSSRSRSRGSIAPR